MVDQKIRTNSFNVAFPKEDEVVYVALPNKYVPVIIAHLA
jgi:hypothetical protein